MNETVGWYIVGFAAILFVAEYILFYLTASPPRIIATPADDAYYYFELAHNLADLGWVTFDEIHRTNGFHPLWLVMLTPLFELIEDKLMFVRAVGVTTSVLIGLSMFISALYLKNAYSFIVGIIAMLGVFFYSIFFIKYNMESSIVIPLSLLALYLVWKFDVWDLRKLSYREALLVGIILSFAQMARLDAVLLTIIVTAILFIGNRNILLERESMTKLAALLVPSGITGCAYLLFNHLYMGHLVPVSGRAKSIHSSGLNMDIIRQFVEPIWGLVNAVLLVVAILYICLYLSKTFKQNQLNRTGLAVGLFYLIQVLYYFSLSSSKMAKWYFYTALLVSVFVVPQLVELVANTVGNVLKTVTTDTLETTFRSIVATALLISLFSFIIVFSAPISAQEATENFKYENYQLAQYTDKHIDEQAIFAMGDQAGAFGYFSQHRVIHLEGLVNNFEVIKYIKNDNLATYMSTEGVDYLVDTEPISYTKHKDIIIPTHPSKIARTHVTVYEQCKIPDNNARDNHHIWSWQCIQNKNSR